MSLDTISTETWRIRIPADWNETKPAPGGGFCFESPDETKAVFVATWNLSKAQNTLGEKVRSFYSVETRTLHAMEGRQWDMRREWLYEQDGCTVAGFDAYDAGSCYRIVSQIIGKDEWIVRSGFHDYHCPDFGKSVDFFEPIVKSLEIHK